MHTQTHSMRRAVALTASEFEDLSYEHEAGLGQGILLAVSLVSIVRQVAVVLRLLLKHTHTHRGRGKRKRALTCVVYLLVNVDWVRVAWGSVS